MGRSVAAVSPQPQEALSSLPQHSCTQAINLHLHGQSPYLIKNPNTQ